MRRWFGRVLAMFMVVCTVFLGIVGYTYSKLPDTFLVPQGQQLTIAPMPWVGVQRGSGASPAGAQEVGSNYNTTLALWGVIPLKTVRTVVVDRRVVSVCGTPFGIKMFSDGAMVVGFTDIYTANGYQNPAKESGLKLGDLLVSIGGAKVTSNDDVKKALQKAQGQAVTVRYNREGQAYNTTLTPVRDPSTGDYKAGMWVRDSSAGVGTLTFVDNTTGMFGGLGHSISDADTGESITLLKGEIVPVEIIGYQRGEVGAPGQLKGRFSSDIAVGTILTNDSTGVYGAVRTLLNGRDMTVAQAQEVIPGEAQVLTTIDGSTPKLYDIRIEKVSLSEEDPNRNMVLRVTDEELLAATGGIVQGMSGSPILQNGRLVGAVTHVLVNDPTRGFGIFAETMLSRADTLSQQKEGKAA